MAIYQGNPRAGASGWSRFGDIASKMKPTSPLGAEEPGQDDDQDSGYEEEPAQTKGYYGEHKGLDFLQDKKGFFQEGKYAGPGLGDAWSSIKDAGGRMGAYFNKPKPTIENPVKPPIVANTEVDLTPTAVKEHFEQRETEFGGAGALDDYSQIPEGLVETDSSIEGWAGGKTGGTAEENIAARKFMGMDAKTWSELPVEERQEIWKRMQIANQGRQGLDKLQVALGNPL